jgi:predicted transposase/invertase (TIGR01784 family)
LKKTISINILNFNYFELEADYHSIFKILHVKSHKAYFEDLELHFIELNKIANDLSHVKTALDRWVNFLKKAHHYELDRLPQELVQEPAIQKAFMALAHLSMNTEEREIYEARLKWLRDEAAALEKKAKESFKKGASEGYQKGMEQGMEQGIKQGVEQGMEQGKAKTIRAIAKNLLSLGELSLEAIAEATGLSVAELISLEEQAIIT